MGAQGVNLRRLAEKSRSARSSAKFTVQHDGSAYEQRPRYPEFKEQWFEQPLDHFSHDTKDTFKQRYWVNTRHYNASVGGPVFVLDGGETSGAGRLPFLDTGIMDILARATGGIGIVLEHRYYGKSVPVQNFTTDSLRFLNNDQSAADSANFMKNVKLDAVDNDVTAPGTPWIYYGGSYAGARAAHMRILYPEIVYGAIASSAVTHAFIEYWEYMDTIRLAADPTCSANLQKAIGVIDGILATKNRPAIKILKSLFGVGDLEHDEDFASLISSPLGMWQAKNWDPEVDFGTPAFDAFCEGLDRPFIGDHPNIQQWKIGDDHHIVADLGPFDAPLVVLNYGKIITEMVKQICEGSVEECFGTFDDSKFQMTSLDQDWRLWIFQVCTEWGYFFVSPPDENHPRIVSNQHTLEYESKICRQAFPPGKHFTVPNFPNVTAVNALGDFQIVADRLAIIDGSVDPWKPATPHSRYAPPRQHTRLRPFLEIEGGVHHWDENGLRDSKQEPAEIQRVHQEMIAFVKEWLANWTPPKN